MESFRVALCDLTEKVLSDRPEGISSKLYPYETLAGGMVKLHDIFKPIFLTDKDLILPKEDADLVCGTYVGYNKKTDVGVIIVRDANGEPEQIVACPAQGQPYIVDFMTAEKFMTVENADDREDYDWYEKYLDEQQQKDSEQTNCGQTGTKSGSDENSTK